MTVLTDPDRVYLWAKFMAAGHCPGPVTKPDMRAAINAVDDWVESMAATYNAALPQPFRGAATAAQKAIVLAYVALRRAGESV